MKTNQITTTLLAAVLLAGTGNLLLGQDTPAACPLGHQPGYRGGGAGRGQGLRAGQGMGQCARRGQCDGSGPQNAANTCPLGQAGQPAGEITTTDANNILFMKQEEKLARDVYLYLDALYGGGQPGTRIFARIAESEQRHTDAVAELLMTYDIKDEVADAAVGEFADPVLQELYDTLIVVGSAGLTEGLGVGVLIERKDMTDIVEAIELSVAYKDIVQVYSNLLAGSENHLEGFLTALEAAEDE